MASPNVDQNTAIGYQALFNNTVGGGNTATGYVALAGNTTGGDNTAHGSNALTANTTGANNTAGGALALFSNTIGNSNTAYGTSAVAFDTTGSDNTGFGFHTLFGLTTGSNNIAIGSNAGSSLSGGDSNNIDIGHPGVAAESGTVRIGGSGIHTRVIMAGIRGVTTGAANAIPVLIDSNGQLGTASSSRRFKDDIADMDAASAALMQLRPVTFHYKSDQDPSGRTLQYGLIAEEVADVYPGLVAHSADGQIETVMYQFLPPMLLNEYQKQQRTIQAQAADLAQQREQISDLEHELLVIKTLLGAR